MRENSDSPVQNVWKRKSRNLRLLYRHQIL